MKKHNLLTPIALVILGVLFSGESFGKNKHVLVKLKGNVLYASKRDKTSTSENTATPIVVVKKKRKTEKIAPIVVVAAPVTETAQATSREVISNATPIQNYAANINFDYEQRQVTIHTSIFQLYPGTYLDSMSIVNSLLSDSLRSLISSTKNRDSVEYYRTCLSGSIKDSITLAKLSILSSPDQQVAYVPAGILIAHCKDASSSTYMDSVVMDVFSGSNLVTSASSDKDGIILAKNVPEGNYYVVFSRKSYEPYSLMQVKVTSAGQSYIDIPLVKANGYVASALGSNGWLLIVTGSIVTLFTMVVLAFYLAKYTSKRRVIRSHGHGQVTTA